MVVEALDPDFLAHRHFVERHRGYRQSVAGLFTQGQADGSIRADVDPETRATEIIAFMQGAEVQWFLDPTRVRLKEVFDAYFDRQVKDLAPPDRSRPALRAAPEKRPSNPRPA
jgi:hypothetical protein